MTKHIYSEETVRWLKYNYTKYGSAFCKKHLNIDEKEMRYLRYKYALRREGSEKIIEPEVKQYLLENFEKLGTKKCAEYLKLPYNKVTFLAKRLNLKCPKSITCKLSFQSLMENKNGENVACDTFSNIDTYEKSYICGLIFADGSVSANRISVTASQTDINEVLNLFETTGKWGVIKDIFKRRSTKPLTTLNAYNTKLMNLFISRGYKEKSIGPHEPILSIIPSELHYSFWRGFFDGDGHCSKQGCCSFSASQQFKWDNCIQLCDILGITFKIELNTRVLSTGEEHKSSTFKIISKDNIYKLYNYLYKDKPVFGFSRKHNQFIECLTYKGTNGDGRKIQFMHHNEPHLCKW